ncbi:Flavin-containing monooxygenase FMO GS-OX-like 7 [Acorus calamus]|uniref:Flavin-containing monooxygenase n=1 Tax=Acorus calamus TaxID=4465 RepID=A0AAV9EH55_ACOCL|nr:Flavin-containing monooxygenase FMO GS-OX-like 7 [Acorus calamus]
MKTLPLLHSIPTRWLWRLCIFPTCRITVSSPIGDCHTVTASDRHHVVQAKTNASSTTTCPNHCAALHVSPPRTARRITVIGAGAAGLVAARELRREGHSVVIFERAGGVGGMWIYDAAVESDLLSLSPRRRVVHTSLYESLRTNLPRESMGFLDYPFLAREAEDGRDQRRFPGHGEVLRYLEDFARDFDLGRMIRFETEVSHVGMANDDSGGGGWTVRSRRADGDGEGEEETSEVYDGVVVCNGHYTAPRVAEIPGSNLWNHFFLPLNSALSDTSPRAEEQPEPPSPQRRHHLRPPPHRGTITAVYRDVCDYLPV